MSFTRRQAAVLDTVLDKKRLIFKVKGSVDRSFEVNIPEWRLSIGWQIEYKGRDFAEIARDIFDSQINKMKTEKNIEFLRDEFNIAQAIANIVDEDLKKRIAKLKDDTKWLMDRNYMILIEWATEYVFEKMRISIYGYNNVKLRERPNEIQITWF